MPGDPADDVHFESRPIPDEAWTAFENSALCEHMHGLPHEGIIGCYEEFWFKAEQLAALVALIETEAPKAPAAARVLACRCRAVCAARPGTRRRPHLHRRRVSAKP